MTSLLFPVRARGCVELCCGDAQYNAPPGCFPSHSGFDPSRQAAAQRGAAGGGPAVDASAPECQGAARCVPGTAPMHQRLRPQARGHLWMSLQPPIGGSSTLAPRYSPMSDPSNGRTRGWAEQAPTAPARHWSEPTSMCCPASLSVPGRISMAEMSRHTFAPRTGNRDIGAGLRRSGRTEILAVRPGACRTLMSASPNVVSTRSTETCQIGTPSRQRLLGQR